MNSLTGGVAVVGVHEMIALEEVVEGLAPG